jgi:hypothetical protein
MIVNVPSQGFPSIKDVEIQTKAFTTTHLAECRFRSWHAIPTYVVVDPRLLQQRSRRNVDSVDSPSNHLMDLVMICLAKVNINQQGSSRVICSRIMLGLYQIVPTIPVAVEAFYSNM